MNAMHKMHDAWILMGWWIESKSEWKWT